MKSETELHFVESVCLPLLRRAQNQDGGWGFLPGSESRVEPTCWALQALLLSTEPRTPEVSRAFQFLYVAQLQDGSWPSVAGDKTGSWVTALACWLLLKESKGTHAATRGLSWLCEDWPRDSSPWRRLLAIFSRQRDVFPINNSYRGWGWTPRRLSSWRLPNVLLNYCLPQQQNGDTSRKRCFVTGCALAEGGIAATHGYTESRVNPSPFRRYLRFSHCSTSQTSGKTL